MMRSQVVVVLVPYPAQGHITPMLQLARALRARGGLVPVMAVPDFAYRRLEPRLDAAGGGCCGVEFTSIPSGLVGDDDDDDGGSDFAAIDGAMESRMPAHFERVLRRLEEVEEELGGRVACVVVDLLAAWAITVAERCGFRTAGFWPAMLATYRIVSAIPQLIRGGFISDSGTPLHNHEQSRKEEEEEEGEEEAQEEGPKLLLLVQPPPQPKAPTLSTKDFPWLVGNKASQKSRFRFWLRTIRRTETLRWLLVNSFPDEEDCEPRDEPTDRDDRDATPQIFQVGPLLANSSSGGVSRYSTMWEEDATCMQWLQNQAPASVTYVSFGSWVGPIGRDRVAEIAYGLEATRRPFLWVLKDDPAWRSGLPPGLLRRAAGRGKVVGWAPQEAVLSHGAVGCYVTHCGWNSTVEAVRHGKRLVCHPISGDQFVNCSYIVRVWRVGLELADGFGRRDVEDAVGRITGSREGEEIQERLVALKEKVMGADTNSRAQASLQLFMDAMLAPTNT